MKVRPHPTLRGGMWMEDYDHLSGLEEFEEGLFFVQDVSSMTAVEAAGICPGDRVLDVCGAPGERAWTRRFCAATERWSAGMSPITRWG